MSININKVSDAFVCPYCFHKSVLSKIQFRNRNQALDNYQDLNAEKYWSQITNGEIKDLGDGLPVLPRPKKRGLFSVRNSAFSNVPVAYFDEGGVPTDIRLCPLCHNHLPKNIGFVSTANIVVIGPQTDDNLKYFMYLMNSFNLQCTVYQTDFFSPQQEVYSLFADPAGFEQNYQSANKDSLFFLTGKLVMKTKNGIGAACEISVTYLPIDFAEYEKYDRALLLDIINNANGIIIAADYSWCGIDDELGDSHDYLLKFSELVHQNLLADDAAPVAVVLSGLDKIEQRRDTVNDNLLCDYECETTRMLSESIVSANSLNFYTQARSLFSRVKFFTIDYNNYTTMPLALAFQNPINWIIKTLNIVEEKEEPEGENK